MVNAKLTEHEVNIFFFSFKLNKNDMKKNEGNIVEELKDL